MPTLGRIGSAIGLLVILAARPFVPRQHRIRRSWLIGENFGDTHRDNGYHLFEYCMENGLTHVHLVVRPDAAHLDAQLAKSPNVVVYGSLRHMILLVFAQTFLYTHTRRDIIYNLLFPLVARRKRLVFLQHGVTAFKRLHRDYQKTRNDADIVLSTSEFERTILVSGAGIDPRRVQVTGFPRYDRLIDRAKSSGPAQILYFPTWRDWISGESLAGSQFQARIKSFLTNDALHRILEQHNAVLIVCAHGRIRSLMSHMRISSRRIRHVDFGERSVGDLICESHMLITDYSSVSWDFLYLGKPVLFYPFDCDDYLRERGSYVDLQRQMFGERGVEEVDLIEAIARTAVRGYRPLDSDQAARQAYFTFHDRDNCRRVVEATARLGNDR